MQPPNSTHAFHDAVRPVSGPPVKHQPWTVGKWAELFKDKQQILQHWAEHFSALLNKATVLDALPESTDVLSAVKSLTVLQHSSSPSSEITELSRPCYSA